MKKIFFSLLASLYLVSCGNPTNDIKAEPLNNDLIVLGYPDTAVVSAIQLTSGKYQSFIVHYRFIKNDSTTTERTKTLYYNIGDTVLFAIQ